MSRVLQVVAGAQFGSEAKGHVTAQLLARSDATTQVCVRVAGPNAGHTVYDDNGNRFALRQVPVGAAVNDRCLLVIAAGSEIEWEVLMAEINLLESWGHDVRDRLIVDQEATILLNEHKRAEAGMHEKIGSTGKGIGAARADRIMRTGNRVKDDAAWMARLSKMGVIVNDSAAWMDALVETQPSLQIVVEGTQGYGLGLHAGHYPQCTSSDCRAIDFLAMAGISPWNRRWDEFQIWLVARVFPIRVAGNSGDLAGETTWDALNLPEEYTTVTKKVRRVGMWDDTLVRAAVEANGGAPTVRVALTMLDQAVPSVTGLEAIQDLPMSDVQPWLDRVALSGAKVAFVGTGPETGVFL